MKKKISQEVGEFNDSAIKAIHNQKISIKFNWHTHDYYELVFIIKGSGTRYIGENISEFSTGEIVFISPGVPHAWYSEKQNDLFLLQIDRQTCEKLSQLSDLLSFESFLNQAKQGLLLYSTNIPKDIRDLKQICKADLNTPKNLFSRFCTFLNLAKRMSAYEKSYLNPQKYSSEISDPRLNHLITWLNENLKDEISLKDAAKQINMQRNAFSRFFKLKFNKNFCLYLQELRIGFACNSLIYTSKTILEICYSSGFGNLSHFNRCFTKIKIKTPSAFRKAFQKTNLFL